MCYMNGVYIIMLGRGKMYRLLHLHRHSPYSQSLNMLIQLPSGCDAKHSEIFARFYAKFRENKSFAKWRDHSDTY